MPEINVISRAEVNRLIALVAAHLGGVPKFCERYEISSPAYYDCRGGRKQWPVRVLNVIGVTREKVYIQHWKE